MVALVEWMAERRFPRADTGRSRIRRLGLDAGVCGGPTPSEEDKSNQNGFTLIFDIHAARSSFFWIFSIFLMRPRRIFARAIWPKQSGQGATPAPCMVQVATKTTNFSFQELDNFMLLVPFVANSLVVSLKNEFGTHVLALGIGSPGVVPGISPKPPP
jgi:hypothetical protein